MHKKFKIIFLVIFLALIFQLNPVAALSLTSSNENVNLILDSLDTGLPLKHFRKTSSLDESKFENLNLTGLRNLNISGSKQFSTVNFSNIVHELNTKLPITVVDLRSEAHGFINEFPISFKNSKNNATTNLSKSEVLLNEANELSSIKLNVPITPFNHPEKTIIPLKVQNEENFLRSIGINYLRLPVKDGHLPEDEIVDSFINFVKSSSNDNWLHFHCKHGIGRTTTFMIMYDIIKNAKTVPLNDIVKRQLVLANFTPKEQNSFLNKDRQKFFNDFYKYSKENNDSFSTSFTQWKKTSPTINYCGFIKNNKMPSNLYVVYESNLNKYERTMLASLQGIASNCSSQIYILPAEASDYSVWLKDLEINHHIRCQKVDNPLELINIFRTHINGYILYSSKNKLDSSINNASSLASLTSSIIVDSSIENKIKNEYSLHCTYDCQNTDEAWGLKHLWNKGLNHSTVIELPPNITTALRDYAIMTKSLVFYESNTSSTVLRKSIFSSMSKSLPLCLGWSPDEFINVGTASQYGVSLVAADFSYNLSVLSSFPCKNLKQHMKSPLLPEQKNCHYITFIMSDGDNQQWELNNNYSNKKWFGSTYRGKFPMNWSLSPSLYFLAPTVFQLYYKNSLKDYFIVPPSGIGYIYPSKFKPAALNSFTSNLNEYMKKVQEHYAVILDNGAFFNSNSFDAYTSKSNIDGLIYLDYHKHNKYKGNIVLSNGKPVISCTDLLWEGIENNNELIASLKKQCMFKASSDPRSYTVVYVHAWSKNMSDVYTVMNSLKDMNNVKVVNIDTFMDSIKNNIK